MAKPRSNSIERWEWNDRGGPARLERELTTRGLSRIRLPDIAASSQDLRAVFVRLFGPDRGLLRAGRMMVHPEPGKTTIVRSNIEGPPHIDDDELMPANVQILCCLRASRHGGDSVYVDSWSLAERIKKQDRALFRSLFEVPRVFRYVDVTPVRPTFSVRYGNLIFSHPPEADALDEIGRRLADWIERSPKYEFRAEPGDICVINNQRILHGRRSFRGRRQFVRLQYWFANGFPGHPDYLARARRFARRMTRHNAAGPTWAREWLQPSERSAAGLSRVAAVIAYLAGDIEVADRLGVPEYELKRWASRALCVAASTLGERDTEAATYRAVIRRQVLAVVDGLIEGRGI